MDEEVRIKYMFKAVQIIIKYGLWPLHYTQRDYDLLDEWWDVARTFWYSAMECDAMPSDIKISFLRYEEGLDLMYNALHGGGYIEADYDEEYDEWIGLFLLGFGFVIMGFTGLKFGSVKTPCDLQNLQPNFDEAQILYTNYVCVFLIQLKYV